MFPGILRFLFIIKVIPGKGNNQIFSGNDDGSFHTICNLEISY